MIRFLLLTLLWLSGCQAKQTLTINETPTIFERQEKIEEPILQQFEASSYDLSSPYLIHDPYQNSPLSYLLMFETENPSIIEYQVMGHTEQATLTYQFDTYETHHQLMLIGLYPDETNLIQLKATDESGAITTHELHIKTPPLPNNSLNVTVEQSQPLTNSTRLFLITDDSYKYLVDEYGEIRFIQQSTSGSITPLPTGNLLTFNGPYYYYYQQKLEEINYLGQVQKQLYVPGAGHHSLTLTTDGDYIINSSDKTDERYTEDHIYVLNSETGNLKDTINLRDYLDVTRFNSTLPESIKGDLNDWFHLNYAMEDPTDQTLIASGRSQSMVVKLDPATNEIKWILGAPDEVKDELQPYLLTPIGENFTWFFAQHSSKVIEDLDQDPTTTDLILFDNHVDIGVFPRESYSDINQYSRAVHYRINEQNMTVEQIWSFGERLNPTLTSTIISEVDYLAPTQSMLVLFGFIQLDQSMGGKLFEVNATDENEILFEMTFHKEGINHIYAVDTLDFEALNLTYTLTDSKQSVMGENNLMLFKDSIAIHPSSKIKSFNNAWLPTIELSDDILYLDGYIEKNQMTDKFALVLTDQFNHQYTFSIHSADCYLVKSVDEVYNSLQTRLKKAIQQKTLYQFIDRINLSMLDSGSYEISFYLESNSYPILYQTNYVIELP